MAKPHPHRTMDRPQGLATSRGEESTPMAAPKPHGAEDRTKPAGSLGYVEGKLSLLHHTKLAGCRIAFSLV